MARQSDKVMWWQMGRTAKAKGMDIAKLAADIKSDAVRRLFLDGAEGKPRPRVRPVKPGMNVREALQAAITDLEGIAAQVRPANTQAWMLDDPQSNLPEADKAALHLVIRIERNVAHYRAALKA